MRMDPAQETLLALLSKALFQKPFPSLPPETDWESVLEESTAQAVVALAFSVLPEGVPSEVTARWSRRFKMELASNVHRERANGLVHTVLTEAGIPYVIFKGSVAARYYPTPWLRALGDVDFLVPPDWYEETCRLLSEQGFSDAGIPHEVEKEFRKDGVIFEVHRQVNGIPGGAMGKAVSDCFESVFDRSQVVRSEVACFYVPSEFHHGLILLLHTARHMITGGVGLRQLCDWAVFVHRMGEEFPRVFERPLRSVGLWQFAQVLTSFAVRYLGCPSPTWLLPVEEDLLESLVSEVFSGGNFGRKDRTRSDEAKFITTRKQGGVDSASSWRQGFRSANEIVRKHWSVAEKIPALYPVGWFFFGGRYAVRALLGKRKKLDVAALMQGAEARKKIYQKLKLFEAEE